MGRDLLDDGLHDVAVEKTHRLETIGQYLEIFPLILFSIGVYLQYKGLDYWKPLILLGGSISILLYAIFSFILFKIGRYNAAELGLSILAILLFPLGASEAFLQEPLPYFSFLEYCLYGCGALIIVSSVLLLLYSSDERASLFHRSLISRLVLIAIVLVLFNY